MGKKQKNILLTFIYIFNIIPGFSKGISMIFKNDEYDQLYMVSQEILNNQFSELKLVPVKKLNNKYVQTNWPTEKKDLSNTLHFVIRYFKNNEIVEAQIKIPIVSNVPSFKYSVRINGIQLDSNKNFSDEERKYCIAFQWKKLELATSIVEVTLPIIPNQSKIHYYYLDNTHVYLRFPEVDKNLKYHYRLFNIKSNNSQAVESDSIILDLNISEKYVVKLSRTNNPKDHAGNDNTNPIFIFKSIRSQLPRQFYKSIITLKGYCLDTIDISNFVKEIYNTTSTYEINIWNKDSLLLSKNILSPIHQKIIHIYPGQNGSITLNNQIIYNLYRQNKDIEDFEIQYDGIEKWISFYIQNSKADIKFDYNNRGNFPKVLKSYRSLNLNGPEKHKKIKIFIDSQLILSKNYTFEVHSRYMNKSNLIKNKNLTLKLDKLESIIITVRSTCGDLLYYYHLSINTINPKKPNVIKPIKRNRNWNPIEIFKDLNILSRILKPHQWSKANYIQRKHTTIGTELGININSYDNELYPLENQSCLGPVAKMNFIPVEIGNFSLKSSFAYSPLYLMMPVSYPSIGSKSELFTSMSIGSFSNRDVSNGLRGLGSSIYMSRDKLDLNSMLWYTDKIGISLYYQNFSYHYLRKYYMSVFKANIGQIRTNLFQLYKSDEFLMGYQVGVESKYGYTWSGQYYHNLNHNYFEIQLLLSLNYSRYR